MNRSWLRDTLLHLRPRSWPVVFAHYCAGTLCAMAELGTVLNLSNILHAAFGGAIWTIGLNGGTLALNSAFDKDTGDIGYLDNPPPVPRGLAVTGFGLMVAALLLAWAFLPSLYTTCLAISVLLSLLYSVPPLRLKAIAGADLLINMIGYGGLTFYAGAASLELARDSSALPLLATSFGFLFAAFYPMTQIYQIESDAAAGDNTLAVRLGAPVSLLFSVVCLSIVTVLQFWAATRVSSHIEGGGFPIRFLLLTISNASWMILALDWLRRWRTYPSQKGMYRALRLWAVSDVLVVLAFFC